MSDPTNPFASPSLQPPVATAGLAGYPTSVAYMRMYNYVFDNPNWMMNVLFGALCGLIPIIGPLLLLGYQFDIIQTLLVTQGARYPDFDFNRFVDYLMGGLWPFLVQLIVSFVLMPCFAVVFFIPFFILMAAAGSAGEDVGPVIFVGGSVLLALLLIPISVIPAMLMWPMMLRAGLTQDFAEGFNFGWALDFLKKTWLEMFLASLFWAFAAVVLSLLGLLACFIGIYLVIPLVWLAQAHLLYQLYLIYLARGGKPIPIKPLASMSPPMPPVSPPRY